MENIIVDEKSSETIMGKDLPTQNIIEIKYNNDEKANLIFSESFIALHSICTIDIKPKYFIDNYKYNYSIIIEFTDKVLTGINSVQTITENPKGNSGSPTKITCNNWYGEGMENTNPILIQPNGLNLGYAFLLKIKTTAFESKPERRHIEISIWEKK